MENEQKFGILGSGGQADEAESYINIPAEFKALSPDYVDPTNPQQINILEPDDYQRMLPVIAAIGAPLVRRKMVEEWPGEHFATIKAETSYVDESTKLAEGVIIAPRAVLTTNIEVGKHSIINVGATISHNSILGEYVTVSPGAHIAGNVELGNGVFVGIGAIISNGVKIADGCVIGAGSVVLKDVTQENSVLIGAPARLLRVNEGWLSEV